MNSFEASRVTCKNCGTEQVPSAFETPCPRCQDDRFQLEIERSAWGIDLRNLLEPAGLFLVFGDAGPALVLLKEGEEASNPYYRTHSSLDLESVSGRQVIEFIGASLLERRAKYVSWKRREVESKLEASQRVCSRCRAIFVPFRNEWHQAGYCSRACYQVSVKEQLNNKRDEES